ncbi:hypothetical protein [uncultured Faecalibaculum sp.]|uniref:hypothetical protein n=1 Tax=uncultured Faecalibaculum sp. TaxID=1729681 RepID=UPI00272DACBB|nr:hypothetical protein [uncultured Faecalibaculum sp.]
MDENVSMVLSLLTGVALFLFGMSSMSDGLKKVAIWGSCNPGFVCILCEIGEKAGSGIACWCSS